MKGGRHAKSVVVRPAFVQVLLIVLALSVLVTPISGGVALGPRAALAWLLAIGVWPHGRARRLAMWSTGLTALGLAAFGFSMDRALATGRPAWLNSATLWLVVAALAGATVWRVRERRFGERERELQTQLELISRHLVRLGSGS